MKFSTFFTAALLLTTSVVGYSQDSSSAKFTSDVHQDIGPGHGAGAKKWDSPKPLFADDLF